MKISFITDEVTQSFDEAVRFARQNGLAGLELRSVEDTAIDMLPAETLRTWRRRLDAEGLTVCGLAGSFYKCAPEPDAVEAELAKLERLCAAADILGCAFIRGFAFFAPEEGPLPAETLAPYFERPVRLLEQRGKTLLLEADPSVNTSNHAALARLVEAIGSPRVRAIFDPGNCLYDPLGETPYPDGYEAIRPFFAHVHIKDAVRAVPESYCVKVGTGQVGYPALLRRLAAGRLCGLAVHGDPLPSGFPPDGGTNAPARRRGLFSGRCGGHGRERRGAEGHSAKGGAAVSTTLLRGGAWCRMAASPAAIFCCAARLWMPSCRRTAARRRTSYMTWPACTSARALSTSTSTEAADTILWTARRRHITARARCTSATGHHGHGAHYAGRLKGRAAALLFCI